MKINIRSDGPQVLLGIDDRVFLSLGHKEAKELAQGLHVAALSAQEHAEAERLIHEGAIMARAGLPLTLSDHPKILDQVRNEAAWNRDLRRYMPGGVRATALVGVPAVLKEKQQ